ncbi:hypothetical protein OFQ98_07775 [Brachyspira hyodysenteriae]|nr:hypothetical protein [Brachyspira hyodysenteriae]MDA0006549.1 hypothetical protein [Brachyspira hyodysenteriae]
MDSNSEKNTNSDDSANFTKPKWYTMFFSFFYIGLVTIGGMGLLCFL